MTLKIGQYHVGILFRAASFWVGVHWSPFNRRYCINLLPCLTVWVALPGGVVVES